MKDGSPRILVVRRDNIGDLVCTTPIFDALRQRFPSAYLCALVTRYNRAVIDRHPAIDDVFAYTKAKHLDSEESVIGNYLSRLRLMLELRRKRFDYCVLAAPGYQERALSLAKWVAPSHVVGFVSDGQASAAVDTVVPWQFNAGLTETEDVWQIVRAFGIESSPGPLRVFPSEEETKRLGPLFATLSEGRRMVGIHISARKPSQRWPAERFAQLMRALHLQHGFGFALLWAPGSAANPRHPGDDEKASEIAAATTELPVLPIATSRLEELIAAISLCDDFICADGGAMHIAAGTGKPIVCLFGHSSAIRWRPWGVPYRLLQSKSMNVADISVDEVKLAYLSLRQELEVCTR